MNPHLVLLPGLDGTGLLFEPFLQQFADRHTVTVVRYPGDRHLELGQLLQWVESSVPKDSPVVLLGESFSGPIVLALAARSVLQIRGLVLVATFACFPGNWLKKLSRLLPLSLLLRLPLPGAIVRRFCFAEHTTAELSALLRNSIRANKPAVLAQRARLGATLDVRSSLKEIRIPCLYLGAGQDKLVPASVVATLRDGLPQLQVEYLDGPHFILQTQPVESYQRIRLFLDEMSAT